MSFEVHVYYFFYFADSRYSSFCISNHPMIYQSCYIIMCISTWDRMQFWIYLLIHNSLSKQTWPIDRINKGSTFQGSFEQFGGLWLSPWPFKFSNLLKLFNNQSCRKIPVFHFFENVNLKMVCKCQLLNMARSRYIIIFKKS